MAGNWKMNLDHRAGAALAKEICEGLGAGRSACEVILIPPFTTLPAVVEAMRGSVVKTGAQDLYCEDEGAFTGEISGADAPRPRLRLRARRAFRAEARHRRGGRAPRAEAPRGASQRAHAHLLRRRASRGARIGQGGRRRRRARCASAARASRRRNSRGSSSRTSRYGPSERGRRPLRGTHPICTG